MNMMKIELHYYINNERVFCISENNHNFLLISQGQQSSIFLKRGFYRSYNILHLVVEKQIVNAEKVAKANIK